jgi:hypothetical protein
MVRQRSKVITTLKIRVETTQEDIDEGECKLITKCMEKIAIARALKEQLHLKDEEVSKLHVRVDGGHIRFNYKGYRWVANTPAKAKNALIRFDRDKSLVRPHTFTFVAARTTKVIPMTDERRAQINMAREDRARRGQPDKVYTAPSVHERVVGYAEGR